MINNRQNGRRRGRGGGNGGQRQGGNPGRPEMGNRIDNRARGNAAQLHEKYKTLARDAQMSGDRVNTEYYLQFADHYFRVLAEQRGRFEDQNQRRPQNDSFDSDDEDYGDEGEPIRADEQSGRNDRSDRGDNRGDRQDPRNDRGDDRGEGRSDRVRADRPRGDTRQRSDSFEERAPRADRGEDRYQRNGNGSNAAAPATADPIEDIVAVEAEAPAEPRRRGRPRKVREELPEAAPAFDADRLPPSLGISASSASADAEPDEEKPRRRRGRPPAAEATQAG